MPVYCQTCKKRFSSLDQWKEYNSSCPVNIGDFWCETDSDVPVMFKFRSNQRQSSYQIIGAPASGKSFYLFTLLEVLHENPPIEFNELNITVEPIHGYNYTQIQDIRTKILAGEAEGTKPDAIENNMPLVFTFKRFGMPQTHLSFFDLSGEHFIDMNSHQFLKNDPRIKYASGIIVLIDPYQDSNLTQMAETKYDVSDRARKVVEILKNVIKERDIRRYPQKAQVPIAFCISMFDVLEEKLENPYLELEDIFTKDKKINSEKIKLNSDRIEVFLKTQGNELRKQVKTINSGFIDYKWFAISSIGYEQRLIPPNGGLSPKGILAPLFWLMGCNGEFPRT